MDVNEMQIKMCPNTQETKYLLSFFWRARGRALSEDNPVLMSGWFISHHQFSQTNDGISEHLTTAEVISRAWFWGLLLPLWAFRSWVLTGLEQTRSENLVKFPLAPDSVTEIHSKWEPYQKHPHDSRNYDNHGYRYSSVYCDEVQRSRVLTTCKCLQVTYTAKPGGWKGTSRQPKDAKWQWTLRVWEARGLGRRRAVALCPAGSSYNAGAAGPDSVVFQKKLQILTLNVTFLIFGSICCNTIELNESSGFSGSWASYL